MFWLIIFIPELRQLSFKASYFNLCVILLSLPEQASLDFAVKCVLPPAMHVVYVEKSVELVFPTMVIAFLLTFISCSVFMQALITKYTCNIFSHTE